MTFHGPGQIVGYPILDLKRAPLRRDLHWYLRQLEAVLIDTLGRLGIVAERRDGLTGVWTNGRKIASIGVHARDWVTWHGFALNVTTDLTFFDLMVPCGITGVDMTSIARELRSGDIDAGHVRSVPRRRVRRDIRTERRSWRDSWLAPRRFEPMMNPLAS